MTSTIAVRSKADRAQAAGEALTRMQNGESLRQIAKDYNVSHVALRAWTLSELPDQYKDAQQQALIARIAQADDALDRATDDLRRAIEDELPYEKFSRIAELSRLNIARDREAAKFARWDAERRLPHLYGAKQEVTHKGIETVIVNRRAAVTIEQGGGTLPDAGMPSREPDRYGITSVDSASQFKSVESTDE